MYDVLPQLSHKIQAEGNHIHHPSHTVPNRLS